MCTLMIESFNKGQHAVTQEAMATNTALLQETMAAALKSLEEACCKKHNRHQGWQL